MTEVPTIRSLAPDDMSLVGQVAQLLHREFAKHYPDAWPTLAEATAEVMDSFGEGRISRIATVGDRVVGWIGAIPQYDGNVYELHPIVVDEQFQGSGIGTRLVQDLESLVIERGGITLWLGSDDERALTSVGGIDLYPDVLANLVTIRNLHSHPMGFYLKNGFSVVGILPDANGIGKPDIYFAKRVARSKTKRP
jgi:aminoglycoside 6'-N-acetyltransferase I